MGATRNWLHWTGWKLFLSLSAILCLSAVFFSWLAIPDFASIAHLRLADNGQAIMMADLPGRPGEDKAIYAPTHGGRIDVSMGQSRVLGAVPDIAGAQLTRDRHFGVMIVPAELTQAETLPVRLALRDDFRGIGMAPVYIGPRIAIETVVDQQRRYGRFMQLLLPVTALITIAVSTLLIFFSRRPRKYFYLILGFGFQLAVELADEPALAFLHLDTVMPLLSVIVNAFIALAIAVWTDTNQRFRYIIGSSATVLLVELAIVRVTGTEHVPFIQGLSAVLFVAWIVGVQLLDWTMILRARHMASRVRTASLAVFLLGCSGLLSYQALFALRPATTTTFLVANYVNVASAMAVLVFVFGSLGFEMLAYRRQVARLGSLERVVAGHHASLDEKSMALKHEIEHSAVLEERQRFLQDMHDGLGGQLLTLLLRLRKSGNEGADLVGDVQAMIEDLRLMTSALDDEGVSLVAALGKLRNRIDLQCLSAGMQLRWEADCAATINLPTGMILNLLRIIEEAATNAVRHSGAQNLGIRIREAGQLLVEIVDNGTGFEPGAKSGGSGLRNIEQRARKLGGVAAIGRSDLGPGTVVRVTFPIPVLISRTAQASQAAGLHEPLRSLN